ncbi:MAG: aromatic amino acid lyase [Ilumatobacteraceae bacterium]
MRDLILGTDHLDLHTLVAWADAPMRISLAPGVRDALAAKAAEARRAAAEGTAYGRTTGVGANRDRGADDRDGGHGMRLVRSHASGWGPDMGERLARATMLVRANQLSHPGSGIPVEVVDGLLGAMADGRTPLVRTFGSLGTGDIASLAELALCLRGERAWRDGTVAAYVDNFDASAALSFISSNATTIAIAALAVHDLAQVIDASLAPLALGAAAIRANGQQWSTVAASTRPSVGVDRTMGRLRAALDGTTFEQARTQDPLSWRVAPFTLGPLLEALDEVTVEIERAADARAENPRFADGAVWHHGAFQHTALGLRLDLLRLAVVQWASTCVARIVKLNDPAYTGQDRFLAHGPAGSSGTMVLEYTATSALETLRTLADPTSRDTASISIGTEDHASFATRGAVAATESILALSAVVGAELVVAARALRGATDVSVGGALARAVEMCRVLPDALDDRSLTDDVEAAVGALPALAAWARTLG